MEEQKDNLNKFVKFVKSFRIHILVIGFILISIIFAIFSFKEPTSFSGMVKKADMYAQNGQIAFALEEYNKLVRLYPENYSLHLKLAKIYEQVDEFKKAKIEYIRAIRLGYKNESKANIGLAKIYCRENNFNVVYDLIKDVEDLRNNEVQKELGNIYCEWGNFLEKNNKPDAIRKFKKAVEHYNKANSKLVQNPVKKIENLYVDISDTLLKSKEMKKTIEMLQLSISYNDNAIAHYKLAKIYEKYFSTDMALKEYSNAFKIDPEIAGKNSYISLLMKKAAILEQEGDSVTSEFYYKKAKNLDSELDIPTNPDNRILFYLLATKVNENIDRDNLIPGIVFRLNNISKDIINYLKVKVVFIKNDQPFVEKIIIIADQEKPFDPDSKTANISIYSNKPVKHIFDDHDLRIQVYISQQSPDKWKLFRNIKIERNRKSLRLKEEK